MEKARSVLGRAVKSGTITGLATAGVASLAGKQENGSFAAPLNATSHILWGDKATEQDGVSLKYTLTGFLLNHASAIFWASFYEKLFGKHVDKSHVWRLPGSGTAESSSFTKPILGGVVVATAAYIIDYHAIPKRFTPGFEKRLSGKSMAVIFATLAAGLAVSDLMDAARNRHK